MFNLSGKQITSKGMKRGNASIALAAILIVAVATYSAIYLQAPHTSDNNIKKFSSYADLESFLKEYSSGSGAYGGAMMKSEMAVADAAISQSESAPRSAGSSDYSNTNIQVQGVDEADIVKNDGKYIYTVSENNVFIVDAYPADGAKIVSNISFNGTVSEIFLNGDRLAVLGQRFEQYIEPVPLGGTASEKMMVRPDIYPRYSPRTSVTIYDVSDKSNPAVLSDISVDGNYYDSRMVGKYVYLIANEPTYYVYSEGENVTVPRVYSAGVPISAPEQFPDVYYFDGVAGNVFTTIASINLESPEDISGKIILTNYAQNMYVSEKNIYMIYSKWMSEIEYIDQMVDIVKELVPPQIQEKINTIMSLEISRQTKWQAIGEIMQNYTASLSSDEQASLEERGREKMEALQAQIAKEREKTVVQKILIDNGKIEYVTNAEVPGNTLNQFSMDEHNGYFRIATTTSGNGGIVPMRAVATSTMQTAVAEQTASKEQTFAKEVASASGSIPPAGVPIEEQDKIDQKSTPIRAEPSQQTGPLNHVYVLDENLNIVGKLEDLASGERIYSVRFLGDKAYMVTFRQMDPLFVIDLSVPQDPKVLGYLKIPGVSDYLHPYDETHVIGVGRDATEDGRISGMKLSLFDVSDVANPKEISKYIIGGQGTSSDALYDHKAFFFSMEKNLLVIPVSEYHEAKTESTQSGLGTFWRSTYEQSAYVFSIDLENGIVLKGKITHANETQSNEEPYYYDYLLQIRRSLYIDNVLYTISQKMIKMNSLDTLEEINKVNLPVEEQRGYGVVY